jgi:hypothetical protein
MDAFDVVVAVDWSAAGAPVTGTDSIWLATSDGVLANPATRASAAELLDGIVATARGRRVLVGVDVPFGYPAGSAAAFGLDGGGWQAMWSFLTGAVTDDDRNRNNRFAVAASLNRSVGPGRGPFWGCPPPFADDVLAATKPAPPPTGAPIAEWRACERHLRGAGLRPFSVWQLAYAGSVGGQALTAIPRLERLRRRHARVEVWPFTTGFVDPACLATDAVVLAEVWPSAFAVDRSRHRVKDAAQVGHVVDELVAADREGALAGWLATPSVDPHDRAGVLDEEGWILAPPVPADTER